MLTPEHCFTSFQSSIEGIDLPERFTYPFYYQPHELCVIAARELQSHLLSQTDWQHDFGVAEDGELSSRESKSTGKMFGVLLVRNPQGELGYLSAFSGKIADQNLLPHFVPPVFDMLSSDSFFRAELAEITKINTQVSRLSKDAELKTLRDTFKAQTQQYQAEEQSIRNDHIAARAARKAQRKQAQATLPEGELASVLEDLGKQSVADKNQLKYFKLEWDEKIKQTQQALDALESQLTGLKAERKKLSNALQHKLFGQYRFLNALEKTQDLNAIFAPTTNPVPPAGAGECAAPKLLQYAYLHGFTPLAMAEFWWGKSPKSEVRQHKKFYPSCHGKCFPILGHMLKGLDVDPNPLEENWAEDKPLEIIYQDEAMVVVNKPSGLLSVPGKTITDSAYTRLQEQFPDVEGPFVIHRLDMATSGLLVFALTRRANKSLQKQFISRSVQKRYMALLQGQVEGAQGDIDLPMRGDPDDRPRQLVCFEHGKPAQTHWELIENIEGQSKLYLYPKTGRTHQLRVHCAHHLGLNLPMVGDTLYGEKTDRLHLHAERLELDHPYSKERMVFTADCNF